MASRGTPVDGQRLREDLRRKHVFYEIFPDIAWQPAGTSFSWLEIALHVEADRYQPPNHPRSREVFSLLVEVAGFLMGKQAGSPHAVHLSASYYTLHPPARGDFSPTRLSRSLSLVFLNMHPYRKGEEPAILTELKTQLSLFDIPRLEVQR